jgi:hypothetical protein
MSRYTHTLTCIIPAPLGAIGAAVGRALDPDTGGDKTFIPMDAEYDAEGTLTKQPTKLWVSNCPVVADLAAGIPYLLSDPAALRGTIERDFAARFPSEIVPTLTECAAFCSAAIIEVS